MKQGNKRFEKESPMVCCTIGDSVNLYRMLANSEAGFHCG